MKRVSVREVRSVLAHLDDVLAAEGELVITRRGRPIARVLPPSGGTVLPSHTDFREAMPRLAVGGEVHIRADRDGR
jgi:antitoxin (DNA-binding transcriptional repressor) of toxin-antitoxin stability system